MTEDDIEDARRKFEKRFYAGHQPSTLSKEASDHRDVIFKRTIEHAIKVECFNWKGDVDTQEYALSRVTDIASMARYNSRGGEVSLRALKEAEQSVIRYWKSRCVIREIFCKLYNENGEPLAESKQAD